MINEDLRNWFNPKHPDGGWKRINSKGEAVGPCARGSSSEPKPKCMSNKKRKQLSKNRRAAAVRAKRRHDPVADRAGKGGKPVNVSNFGKGRISEAMEYLTEKNVPTNPELWSKAKSLARSKFDVYPSAYANGWAAKWYKSKGGGWKKGKKKKVNEELAIYHRRKGKYLVDPEQIDPETGAPMPAMFALKNQALPFTQGEDQSDLMVIPYDPKKEIMKENKLSFFYRHQKSKLLGEDHAAIESGEMVDDEGQMAANQLDTIQHAIERLRDKIKGKKQQLPAWVQSKITKATDGIDTVADYMSSDSEEELNENFIYDHGANDGRGGYRPRNPGETPPPKWSENQQKEFLGGLTRNEFEKKYGSIERGLKRIVDRQNRPKGLRGLIQRIKGVFVREDVQGNKESYEDYQARLQELVGAGRFNQLVDHHDKIHAAMGFLKGLQGYYRRSTPLIMRVMGDKGGHQKHARGLIVSGVRGMNLIGRPSGAGGHAASHKTDIISDIKNISGISRSHYTHLEPHHFHTLMSIFGDMFTKEGKQRLEESKEKPYKGFKKGKNHPEGGLSRAEARRQGIHAGIETKREAQKKGGFGKLSGKTQKRRKSFCSRMCGMKRRRTSAKTARDPKSKINAALRVWGCRCESYNPTCDVCEHEKQLLMHEEVVNKKNKGTMTKAEIKNRDEKAKGIKPQPIKGDTDDESRHRIATYITLRARGGKKKKKAKK
jgi:hypothetical protein